MLQYVEADFVERQGSFLQKLNRCIGNTEVCGFHIIGVAECGELLLEYGERNKSAPLLLFAFAFGAGRESQNKALRQLASEDPKAFVLSMQWWSGVWDVLYKLMGWRTIITFPPEVESLMLTKYFQTLIRYDLDGKSGPVEREDCAWFIQRQMKHFAKRNNMDGVRAFLDVFVASLDAYIQPEIVVQIIQAVPVGYTEAPKRFGSEAKTLCVAAMVQHPGALKVITNAMDTNAVLAAFVIVHCFLAADNHEESLIPRHVALSIASRAMDAIKRIQDRVWQLDWPSTNRFTSPAECAFIKELQASSKHSALGSFLTSCFAQRVEPIDWDDAKGLKEFLLWTPSKDDKDDDAAEKLIHKRLLRSRARFVDRHWTIQTTRKEILNALLDLTDGQQSLMGMMDEIIVHIDRFFTKKDNNEYRSKEVLDWIGSSELTPRKIMEWVWIHNVSPPANLQKGWVVDFLIALFLKPDLNPRSRMNILGLFTGVEATKEILLERCRLDPGLAVRLLERIGDDRTCKQVRLGVSRFPSLLNIVHPCLLPTPHGRQALNACLWMFADYLLEKPRLIDHQDHLPLRMASSQLVLTLGRFAGTDPRTIREYLGYVDALLGAKVDDYVIAHLVNKTNDGKRQLLNYSRRYDPETWGIWRLPMDLIKRLLLDFLRVERVQEWVDDDDNDNDDDEGEGWENQDGGDDGEG